MMTQAPLPYTIRPSRRARHLRLVVRPEGVELVLPEGVSEGQALRFLKQHQDWAERKWRELLQRQRAAPERVARRALAAGSLIPFQGREVPLMIHRHTGGRRGRLELTTRGFEANLPEEAMADPDATLRSLLMAWVKLWMGQEARRIVARHGPVCGLYPRSIRIKSMRTRWGSCGSQNDINLNRVLAFAEPAILEYVVVHELCHIRHRNHSTLFWDLVSHHLPEWPLHRQWLKRQGGALLREFG